MIALRSLPVRIVLTSLALSYVLLFHPSVGCGQAFQLGVHDISGSTSCQADVYDSNGATYSDGGGIPVTPTVTDNEWTADLDATCGAVLNDVGVCPENDGFLHTVSEGCRGQVSLRLVEGRFPYISFIATGDAFSASFPNCTAFANARSVQTGNILWNDVLYPGGPGDITAILNVDFAPSYAGPPSGRDCATGSILINFTDQYGHSLTGGYFLGAELNCSGPPSPNVVPAVVIHSQGSLVYIWGQLQASAEAESALQTVRLGLKYYSGIESSAIRASAIRLLTTAVSPSTIYKQLFYLTPGSPGESVTTQSGFNYLSPCSSSVSPSKATVKVSKLGTPNESFKFAGMAPFPGQFDTTANGVRIHLTDALGNDVLDVTIPGGAYDTTTKTGWRHKDGGPTWTYKNPTGLLGIQTVRVKQSVTNVSWKVKGKGTSLRVGLDALPLVAEFQAAPATPQNGLCARAKFAIQTGCVPNAAGTGFGCS